MKTEFLKGFGLSDEDIQKILAENGRDVEREKAKTDAANEEIKTLKADKESLEGKVTTLTNASGDADKIKKELDDLKATIEAEKETARKEAEDKALTDSIVSLFGEKKFTSDYARDGLIADMKVEIAKPENKGKGYAEILDAYTKDKEGIFANPNPPAGMPGMGKVDPVDLDDAQARAVMGLPPLKN